MRKFSINSEGELETVAEEIIGHLEDFPIACFYGEMGAGKTTLIKKICATLEVTDSMSSPTFSIINEYRDSQENPIYHFDFYRIKNREEALNIGAEEYFYSGEVCLIEWPEMINGIIPERHLEISIKLVGENGREITIKSNDR